MPLVKTPARGHEDQTGVVLIGAILTLLAIAIFLPALWYVTSHETKWSVREKKTTIAFHMAEQGLDRGIWKLQESDALYTMVSTNGIVPGYIFDVIYDSSGTDGSMGEYKIKLTTASTSGRVLVQSIGRDSSTDEVRSIEAEYTQNASDAGMLIRGGLAYKSDTTVHWGPVVCYGSITAMPNNPDDGSVFPRKIAKGSISRRDVGHGDTTEIWDGTHDYRCHATDLGDAPTIRLDDYRELARNSRIPNIESDSGGIATAVPVNSGYFPTDGINLNTPGGNVNQASDAYIFRNSTSVIFIEKAYNFNTANKYSQIACRAIIMPQASLNINGNSSFPPRKVKIPSDAQSEYLHNSATYGNATTAWTSVQGNNATAFSSTGAGNMFFVEDVAFHAFMYFKEISNAGTNLVVAGILDLGTASNPQSDTVYYDETISSSVLVANQVPRQISWRETKLSW